MAVLLAPPSVLSSPPVLSLGSAVLLLLPSKGHLWIAYLQSPISASLLIWAWTPYPSDHRQKCQGYLRFHLAKIYCLPFKTQLLVCILYFCERHNHLPNWVSQKHQVCWKVLSSSRSRHWYGALHTKCVQELSLLSTSSSTPPQKKVKVKKPQNSIFSITLIHAEPGCNLRILLNPAPLAAMTLHWIGTWGEICHSHLMLWGILTGTSIDRCMQTVNINNNGGGTLLSEGMWTLVSAEEWRATGQARNVGRWVPSRNGWVEYMVFTIFPECQPGVRDFSSVCGEQKGCADVLVLSSLLFQVTLQWIFWGCYCPKKRAVFQGEWIL